MRLDGRAIDQRSAPIKTRPDSRPTTTRASSLKSESMGFPYGRFCDSPYVEVDHGEIAITGYSGACCRFG